MRLRKLSVVLLALLLAAMAMVPMVSAGEDQSAEQKSDILSVSIEGRTTISDIIQSASGSTDPVEMNYVSYETAKSQAMEALAENIVLKKFGEAVVWDGAYLNEEPLVVFDMDGKMLFYQFWVEKNNIRVGEIKIAASKVLGSPVQVVGTSSPEEFSLTNLQTRARAITAESFKGYAIRSSKIVMYDYPRMGLLVEVIDPITKTASKFIVDTNKKPDFSIISNNDQKTSLVRESDRDTTTTITLYELIPKNKIESNIAIWNKENQRINAVNEKIFSGIPTESVDKTNRAITTIEINSKNEADMATMMAGQTRGERRLLRNGLYPTVFQGYDRNWCMVAAAHTMTTYYYLIGKTMDNGMAVPRARTLDEIASKMGASGNSGASSWYTEQQYYRDSWSSGGLGLSAFLFNFQGPTMNDIKSQIQNANPLKIGTKMQFDNLFGTVPNGHARACYGYDTTLTEPTVYFSDSYFAPQGKLTYEVYHDYYYGNGIKI